MLLTHGYAVSSAESMDEVELPFTTPPDLVLIRANESPDRSHSAFNLIRNAAPTQRIGFLIDDGHNLCQLFINGVLVRPKVALNGDLIGEVEAMLDTQLDNFAQPVSIAG
jgi:hypothetical protein